MDPDDIGSMISFLYELKGMGDEHRFCPGCKDWVNYEDEGVTLIENEYGEHFVAPPGGGLRKHYFDIEDTLLYLSNKAARLLEVLEKNE